MGAIQSFAIALLLLTPLALQCGPASAEDRRVHDLLTRGDGFRERGSTVEAHQCYMQAVSLEPKSFLTHRSLASSWAAQKKYSEALAEINLAIGLNPNYHKLLVDRGLYYVGLGRQESAQADFRKAVATPDCGHTVYKYLEDYDKSHGRLDQAIAISDLHMKREPNEDSCRERADLLSLKKDYAGARQALAKAITIAPFNYLNYELRGDASLAADLPKEAVADYTKALSFEPMFPCEIYEKRAQAYAKLGKKDLEQKDIKSSQIKD